MEGGILALGAVTGPMPPRATAAPFEEDQAAAAARRYLRSRELPDEHRAAAGDGGRDAPPPPGTAVRRRAGGPGITPRCRRGRPVPSPPPHGVPERGQAAGAGAQPGGRGGGAWTDPAMPTSAGRRGGGDSSPALRGPRPPCSAPAPAPHPAFPRPGWGGEGGGQLPSATPAPPRQLGLGVKTVIAVPDRVAAAARLLPAAARTGTASPGPTGVTDPLGGGGRSRVSPPPRAVRGSCSGLPASPGCRCLSLILCLPEESVLLQSNLRLIQSRQISS